MVNLSFSPGKLFSATCFTTKYIRAEIIMQVDVILIKSLKLHCIMVSVDKKKEIKNYSIFK